MVLGGVAPVPLATSKSMPARTAASIEGVQMKAEMPTAAMEGMRGGVHLRASVWLWNGNVQALKGGQELQILQAIRTAPRARRFPQASIPIWGSMPEVGSWRVKSLGCWFYGVALWKRHHAWNGGLKLPVRGMAAWRQSLRFMRVSTGAAATGPRRGWVAGMKETIRRACWPGWRGRGLRACGIRRPHG